MIKKYKYSHSEEQHKKVGQIVLFLKIAKVNFKIQQTITIEHNTITIQWYVITVLWQQTTKEERLQLKKQWRIYDAWSYHTYYDYNNSCLAYHHKSHLAIIMLWLQALKSLNYDVFFNYSYDYNCGGNFSWKYGVSHTGTGVSEYGVSFT